MNLILKGCIHLALLLSALCSYSQDTAKIASLFTPAFTQKYTRLVSSDLQSAEKKIDKASRKYLLRMARLEQMLKRRLSKIDAAAAQNIFSGIETKYSRLLELQVNPGKDAVLPKYIPRLDSLTSSLKFIRLATANNPSLENNLSSLLSDAKRLESGLFKANEITDFIKDRKQFLQETLQKYGLGKQLRQFNKEVYYYTEQIKEYQSLLNDPAKIERKVISLLTKLPAFQQFLKQHSALAGLFKMPGDQSMSSGFTGLPTRAVIQQLAQQRLPVNGASVQQTIAQSMQQAKTELNKLKTRVNQLGGLNSDKVVGEFTPNTQKTKSFRKRLQFGTNFQTARSNYYFPATADLGLSVGYKLSDKAMFGIGTAYKLGLGSGWNNISFTHEGLGLRSFFEWKLKGSFYFSGGYEQNYLSRLTSYTQLYHGSGWKSSALIGLNKKYKLGKKFNGNFQVFYDVFHDRQVPTTQAILFRTGYTF